MSKDRRSFGRLGVGLGVPALLAACACATNFTDYGDDEAKLGGGSGAAGAAGVAGAAGASSHPPVVPEPEPGCVPAEEDLPDDDFTDTNCDGIDGDVSRAIFVDPLGAHGGDGSIGSPVATLKRGIALAAAASKDVYLCTSTYEENVVIEGLPVRIYGGYDCRDGWRRKPVQATVAPVEGLPLVVRDVSGPVVIHRVRFVAPDAVLPGESSIAAVVLNSPGVQLGTVDLMAGDGAHGEDGIAPANYTTPPARPPAGKSATVMSTCWVYGAAPASCMNACLPIPWCCEFTAATCPKACRPKKVHATCAGVVSGSEPSEGNLPGCPTDGGLVARSYAAGGKGGNGYTGVERTLGAKPTVAPDAGQPGAYGASAQSGFGDITELGEYVPSNRGTAGKFGRLGAAGNGGNGGTAWESYGDAVNSGERRSGAGGRGGAAGCGGRPGQPGGGGGASLALVTVNSPVELERVLLRTGSGGRGGHGAPGGAGEPGGAGSVGGRSEQKLKTGEDGEPGTAGGAGGKGGSGGGGPSIGVVAVGSEPGMSAVVFDTGTGGPGGEPVTGKAPSGARGTAQDVYFIDRASGQ